MIKLCPLFSGSSGNSVYVGVTETMGILVDAGRTAKQLDNLLFRNGINVNNIKVILVTHEHSDHVSALKVFAKKHGIKIYASEGTISALKSKGIITKDHQFEVLSSLSEKNLEFASIRSFNTSHDCSQSMGYVISDCYGDSIAVCTDLGYVSDDVRSALAGCRSVLIESNHDVMMLQNGPYPYYLKRRILSDKGHLSNDACSEFLPYLVNKGAKNIILSHLSEHNNLPDLARKTAIFGLEENSMRENVDFRLFVAPKLNEQNLNIL